MKEITVIGAGVIGLTTALKIQESGGYHVTIIAEVLPADPKSIKYTSHWAGANHLTRAGADERQHKMDFETFDEMWKLSDPEKDTERYFMRLTQYDYYCNVPSNPALEAMPDFKPVPTELLTPGSTSGVSFTTVTIDAPVYLQYLLARFLSAGGEIIRGHVQHINEIIEGGPRVVARAGNVPQTVDALVVCVGLEALTLGGVSDTAMFPIRGQTVLLRAPWIRHSIMINKSNEWTYVIPRRSGDVILGGTIGSDDWYPAPRPETREAILARNLLACPELAPPEIRAVREPTVDDLRPLIIEEGVGLRPGRKGGVRLEVEWVSSDKHKAGKVPVIYNYGHGGYGYQSSWGSASFALNLLKGAALEMRLRRAS